MDKDKPRQNTQVWNLECENKAVEAKIRQPYFNKIIVTDPIILFPDQWERLKGLARTIVPAGEQTKIEKLYEESEREKKPICWTQLASRPPKGRELQEALSGADAAIMCWTFMDDETLKASKGLKYVGYWTHQAAHRVNFELAKELGICVDYVPDYGTHAVAQQTLLGMLAILRTLPEEMKMTREGKWHYELLKTRQRVPLAEDQIPQQSLEFKKVGIVGWGPIAQRVNSLLKPFYCNVSYWTRSESNRHTEEQAIYKPLEEIFQESDIVTVHLNPYAGNKVISEQLINSMRNGSIFVNTSHGDLVDQAALFNRLRKGEMKAYLDVYERLPPKDEIRELSAKGNIFTYRASWFERDAIRLKGEMFLCNMEQFIMHEETKAAALVKWMRLNASL